MRSVGSLFVVFLAACGSDLSHDSPFDPQSPSSMQARASLVAKLELRGESDSAGIHLVLQSSGETYAAETTSDGRLRLAGIVPGRYDAVIEARYFAPVRQALVFAPGEEVDLGSVALVQKTAQVHGRAFVERLDASKNTVRQGGVNLVLRRVGSIRGSAADSVGAVFATVSASDGEYVVTDVPAGLYAAEASTFGLGGVSLGEVEVTGEQDVVTLADAVLRQPTGTFEIEGTAKGEPSSRFSQLANVSLKISAFGATKMRIGRSASGAADACVLQEAVGIAATAAYTLPGEGVHVLCAAFLDESGNESAVFLRSITFDRSPPTAASLQINGGAAFAFSPQLSLSLSAFDVTAGVESMMVSGSADFGGAVAQPYTPALVYPLANTADGTKFIYAKFSDAAGNWSAPVSDAVEYDLRFTDEVTAVMEGTEGIAGRTASSLVTIRLDGLVADSYEMQLANDSNLTGAPWSPVTTTTTWLLPSGDGIKTVYVRVRDRAGNLSATLSPQIFLAQTGPEVPGLILDDVTGDGFSLGSSTVELRWSTPASPYLAGYELERYVEGYDPSFGPLVSLPAGTNTFIDNLGPTVGYQHHYRVRAFDDLGNASSWSLAVHATPYEPIAGAFWVRDVSGDRYFFPPNRGTFSLRPIYRFDDEAGGSQSVALTQDVSSWTRTSPVSFRANERLHIRTANQDNGLILESLVELGFDTREKKTDLGSGNYPQPVAPGFVDASGVLHVCYKSNGYSFIGCWAKTPAGWTSEASPPFVNNDVIDMAAAGGTYAFASGSGYQDIHYFTKTGAGWSPLETVEAGNFFNPAIALDGQGHAHLSYVDNATSMLHYANNVTGQWAVTVVGPAVFFTDIAVDSSGFAHVVAYNGGPVYYTNKSGAWAATVLDAGNPYYSITLDAQDHVFIVYANYSQLVLASDETGAFATTVLAAVDAIPHAAINFEGEPEVVYFAGGAEAGLHVLRRRGGVWADTVVENSGLTLAGYGLIEGADAKAYVPYVSSLGELGIVSLRQGPVLQGLTAGRSATMMLDTADGMHAVYADAITDSLFALVNTDGTWRTSYIDGSPARPAYAPSVAADATGFTHVTYHDWISHALWYANNGGGTWAKTQVDAAGDMGRRSSLAIDASGNAHIAYLETAGYYWQTLLRYAENTGGTWYRETVALPDPQMTYAHAPVLIYDAQQTLHLFVGVEISDGTVRRLLHGIRDGGAWNFETLPAGYPSLGGDVKAVAFDAANAAHVLTGNGGGQTLYATNAGGSWSRTVLEAVDGQSGGIAVDERGFVHAIYDDDASRRVRYATNALGGWLFATLDATDQPIGSALAIDQAGRLHAMFTRFQSSEVLYEGNFAAWKPAKSVTRVLPFQ